MNTKYLLALGLPLALSGALLAGCNPNGTTETSGASTRTAQSEAPAGSTAQESEEKTGVGKANPMAAVTHSTKLDFSSEPAAIPVGKPATWTLKITDAQSGQPVNDFVVEMTKLMHLIVVKKDLSWFNHIHPEYQGNGVFTVTETLPSAGSYKIYADYTPKGRAQEVPQHEFATGGQTPQPVAVHLTPDTMKNGWMTKKFVAHPEGHPDGKGGATYEVALMPMPVPIVAGQDTMLHFQIRDAKGTPIKDLQPYLGAMGHAVILSSDSTKYLHSHPMTEGAEHDMSNMGDMSQMKESAPPKSGGPDVMFHTNFPTAGLYKAWGQFQHKGQIITAAFVLNVGAPKVGATTGAAHDEAQPHSH